RPPVRGRRPATRRTQLDPARTHGQRPQRSTISFRRLSPRRQRRPHKSPQRPRNRFPTPPLHPTLYRNALSKQSNARRHPPNLPPCHPSLYRRQPHLAERIHPHASHLRMAQTATRHPTCPTCRRQKRRPQRPPRPSQTTHHLLPPRLTPKILFPFDRNNAVDYIFIVPPPGQRAEIPFIMQIHFFSAGQFQPLGNALIVDAEIELVTGYHTRRLALDTRLDQLALVGLPDISFPHHIVERPRPVTILEYAEVSNTDKHHEPRDHHSYRYTQHLFHKRVL